MEYIAGQYDVVVVGAGHAGCEASLAAARLGCKTAVFAINLDSIANMPCNPSIGGTAKGHLVREIDALGGEMGKNTDKTFIQSKILNKKKGPAVFSLRAQADRKKYHIEMKHTLEKEENLDIWCYTGYTIEEILKSQDEHKLNLLKQLDVLVDGKFQKHLMEGALKYTGSRNQRIINLKEVSIF